MKLLLRAFLTFTAVWSAHGAYPTVHMKPVVLQQFHSPTCIVAAPDGSGRLFVCDQPGRIHIIENGMMRPVPFLDISNTAANTADRKVIGLTTSYNERGLLGMAFHPGYANPASPGYRKFFLNYNKTYQVGIDPAPHSSGWTPNCTTVVAEFQVTADANIAAASSERKLLQFAQPQTNHNGGVMTFDAAGRLYIGVGDGGSANDNNLGHTGGTAGQPTNVLGNGQDKTVLFGKILRIDPLDPDGAGPLTYAIPPSNPFIGEGGGVKEEIYAYGIRNPWGLSFDDGPGGTGRLFCADVGQLRVEEVNLIVSGGNYGWRYKEGTERPSFSVDMAAPAGALIDPIAQYGHPGITGTSLPLIGLSITGGHVYRGSAMPDLQGKYIFGDYGATAGSPSGVLMGLEETSTGSGVFTLNEAIPVLGGNPISARIMCIGRDNNGELYIGTKNSAGVQALENGLPNGGLYKLVPAPVNPAPVVLTAVKDSTIFSESGGSGEELANGQGPLFSGASASGDIRRALLRFDLSSIPAGSRFSAAMLRLYLSHAETGAATQRNTLLHRVLADWGEGPASSATAGVAAQNGDVTWFNSFFSTTAPVAWTNEGGDYNSAASAGFYLFAQTGVRSFLNPQMVSDVHGWVNTPGTNFGWLISTIDTPSTATAKTFGSREDVDVSKRPQLVLIPATPYEKWFAQLFPAHLTGQWVDPDLDGDGMATQLEYAFGYSPLVYDATNGIVPAFTVPSGGTSTLTTTFRRDSAAVDLTYRLEVSGDLTTWTTIAQSVAGAAATGQNGGVVTGESIVSGTVREVNVTRAFSGGDALKQFVRLAVDRAP